MEDFDPSSRPRFLGKSGACPVAGLLRTLGGKHKPNILHALSSNDLHFLELTRSLPGISRKVLVEQLRDLERAGLVARHETQDARRRVSYALTEKARALGVIVSQLSDWSEVYEQQGQPHSDSP